MWVEPVNNPISHLLPDFVQLVLLLIFFTSRFPIILPVAFMFSVFFRKIKRRDKLNGIVKTKRIIKIKNTKSIGVQYVQTRSSS